MAQKHPPDQDGKAIDAGNRQSHATQGESFVLVDSVQGLDIGEHVVRLLWVHDPLS